MTGGQGAAASQENAAALVDLSGRWRGPLTETNPLGTQTFLMTLKIEANPRWTNIFTGTIRDNHGHSREFWGTLSRAGKVDITVDRDPGIFEFRLTGKLTSKNSMAGDVRITDIYGGVTTGTFTFIRGKLPDLVAVSLRWDTKRGGVNLSYLLTGRRLFQNTTAELYWSTGPTENDIIEPALNRPVVIQKTLPVKQKVTLHLAPSRFVGDPPPEATHLVMVLNPNNTAIESRTANNVKAAALVSEIKLLDATARANNLSRITIKYSISEAAVRERYKFRAFLSTDSSFDEGDTPLPGKVIEPVGLKPGPDGKEKVYWNTFRLTSRPQVSKESPFIIIVADFDDKIREISEDNNEMFVIPVFSKGQYGGFHPTSGAFRTGVGETATVGAIGAHISRGTTEFDRLLGNPENNIRGIWQGNGRTFELRDGKPFVGDDWLVQWPLAVSVLHLVDLIDTAKAEKRLRTSFLCITDAFDERGSHSATSKHYEGRAIDFDTNDKMLGKLSGLAMLAGFDWVYRERTHVHASQRGERANVSADLMLATLDFGSQSQPKLIKSQARYDALYKSMADAKTAMESDNKAQARAALQRFANQALVGQNRREIRPGFAKGTRSVEGLLRFNANRLAKQWGIALSGIVTR